MRQAVNQSAKLAGASLYWLRRVMPRVPDLDPHDVHLVLLALLRRHPVRRRLLNRALRHG
jgi:hypothetical protein